MTPSEALGVIRDAVLPGLTMGQPHVVFLGFDGAGAAYDCGCDDGAGQGVLRVEWDSGAPAPDGDDDIGISGMQDCLSWNLTGSVSIRRCWQSFTVISGWTDGSPVDAADASAICSAMSDECFGVLCLLRDAGVEVSSFTSFGPDGGCAGWDISWSMIFEGACG